MTLMGRDFGVQMSHYAADQDRDSLDLLQATDDYIIIALQIIAEAIG